MEAIKEKTPVTKEEIIEAIKTLGVGEGDTLLVHSGLGKVGRVIGGAQTVIDAFEGIIGKEGTLVMPTFSQCDFANVYKTWYMDKPSDTGYLTEYFRKLPFVYRSNQETHSVAARGKLAYELTYQHKWFGPHVCPFGEYAFADSSPWKKMYDLNAKVLFFGIDMLYFTFKHVVEARVTEHYLGMMDEEQQALLKSEFMTPETLPKGFWLFYSSAKMQAQLAERGLVRQAECGDVTVYLVDAKTACDATYEIIMSDPLKWFGEEKMARINRGIEASKKMTAHNI